MKSNQKLKQEARLKHDQETRHEVVLGGEVFQQIENGVAKTMYRKFKNLNVKKQKNITTASIRAEHGREKINYKKQVVA